MTVTPTTSISPTQPASINSLLDKPKGDIAGESVANKEGFFSKLFKLVFSLLTFNTFSDDTEFISPLAEATIIPTSTTSPNHISSESTSKIAGVQRTFPKVVRVIDGDTIEIEGGDRVRYIGIDTPETVDPRKPVQCYGQEASNKNKELVEGKTVELEKDVSETDKYGRLLRYVWLGDMLGK